MVDELVAKLTKVAAIATPGEADARLLHVLARTLIERLPDDERANYGLLKFYADWSVHSKLDRSEIGARVLQQINDLIFDHTGAHAARTAR